MRSGARLGFERAAIGCAQAALRLALRSTPLAVSIAESSSPLLTAAITASSTATNLVLSPTAMATRAIGADSIARHPPWPARPSRLARLAADRSRCYVLGMEPKWPRRKWVLAGAGALAAVSFLGALFLALSGKSSEWFTFALAGGLILIVLLQLARRDRPKA